MRLECPALKNGQATDVERHAISGRTRKSLVEIIMRQGSTGNVIAALVSFFIPGLGQLTQGRVLAAIIQFVLTALLWVISFGTLGWIGHILSCIDAARWKAR
jgi:TM2 domain-containing membrane protein YozV